MSKLLKLTLSGVKNIEEPLSMEFSNLSMERMGEEINKTKGIFGYNGSGKSAIVDGVYLYKMILLSPNFLLQNQTQEFLEETLNRKTKRFEISFCFLTEEKKILRHSLTLSFDQAPRHYLIGKEALTLLTGRTLNEGGETLFSKVPSSEDSSVLSPYQSLVSNCVESLAKKGEAELSKKEKYAFEAFVFASQLDVYLQSEALPRISPFDERLAVLLGKNSPVKETDPSKETIKRSEYASYEKANASLEKFVRLFKPALLEIRLNKTLEGELYHVRREFVYDDYAIDFAYESSGIKQLVSLYHYLKECSEGGIVFIDEIDVNLNTAYFKKLIAYFQNYGKGQLVFTTHNVEAMEVLKKARRGIEILGSNGKAYTWVARGNRSPVKEYLDGYIPHSPLNIEDFDFIGVFQNEEEDI